MGHHTHSEPKSEGTINRGTCAEVERLFCMKPKNLGIALLAVYLIIVGLIGVFGISLGQLSIVLPILAIAVGICLLIGK